MKHYIIVKYTPEVTKELKQQLLEPIRELFSHLYEIEGITSVEVCPNCVDRSNRYDLMIEIEMEKDALPIYDESQWHHMWKQQYSKYIEKKTIFDRP